MRIVSGDLFQSTAGAIGHGVNCMGVMGAGIARLFKRDFPEMFKEYKILCDEDSLHAGEIFAWQAPTGQWVYNMASQHYPGANAHLKWLESAAVAALTHADAHGVREVALPQIGCGIGGLKWEDVQEVLERVEKDFSASFVVYVL
jgi:O-acetyl-ADP-ribose deacetylase (regulator of RNase III)